MTQTQNDQYERMITSYYRSRI